LIYLDTSVALAHILAEDRAPPAALWEQPLIASRLLEYEIWTRLHARRLGESHNEDARFLIGRVALIELVPPVLARALEPFPISVRTLDALHLASIEFLRLQGQTIELASYDDRLLLASKALGIPIVAL
jgi:predicted nucleic acid-binding protein